MDPDQWFRLWLALCQGLIGGAVTLAGGYVGYRLAGRAERDKHKTDALRRINDVLRDMTRFVQAFQVNVPLDLVSATTEKWNEVLEDDPPPKGTPANIIAVESLVATLEITLVDSRAFDAEVDRETATRDELVTVLRKSRAECSRWITDGAPSQKRLTARHNEATKRRDEIMAEMGAMVAARRASR